MRKLGWVKRACGIFLLCTTAAIALPAQTTGNAPAVPIFTLLQSFGMTGDGASPYAGLVQGTDGNFYGTTEYGGANLNSSPPYYGCGTVFSLSVGLGAFVETQPTTGRVGAAVKTLRTNLTGTTQHHL